MKHNTGPVIANTLRTLMEQCQVNILQACKRSGVTPSTFYRWQDGSTPGEDTVRKMKLAILEIASDNNTLPAKLVAELDTLRATAKTPQTPKKRGLHARVERLERVVTDQLGATL